MLSTNIQIGITYATFACLAFHTLCCFVLGEFFHHLVTKTKSRATHTKDLGRKISLRLPDFEEKVSEIVIFRQ
jgi:hypothetical protein